ncbi:PREDICTED: F-box/kelch-repeat protein At3g23880-like [Nicotiana attenuata]|uniref:F-boxkelch-repeat protein n=1 Tax=Nicotiana attenuata TaxID=49451 RepID=A0A1J6KYW1_NICAT|nr:PREDICTED: F-box/kelch-repeat protein At3g23880-like [Nicotiana attenuata]OIT27851.1 f-boxkelch-repeat protein [Nicotiana attenuata]
MEETAEGENHLHQELPQELIIEILVRLPVKLLLKFRCVSKSWLSLLSNTEFHKTHVNFSIKNPKMTDYTIAGVTSVSGLGKICHVYTIKCENLFITVAKHGCPPKSLPLSAWLLGSCNGLVCLTSDSFTLMLLNPCTGNFNVFPDTMSQYKVGAGGCYVRYGFGYDASIEDYKVVKIFSFPQNEGRHENIVKVYSLKANSWSTIHGFNSGRINGMVGVFVNGALHWDVCHPHISRAFSEIVTLDLAAERHGKIALPSNEDGGIHWTLGVSRGRLVACCNYETNKADMWVMKEYGVEKSWTKLVAISLPVDRRVDITPLYVAENGDVLLKLGTELILYNSRNTSFKRLADYVSGDFLQVQVATYLESLTSPHIW